MNDQIAPVEFTTDTAAEYLGIPPEQVRLLARKLGISAPYTKPQIEAMQLELSGGTIPVPAQTAAPIPTDEPQDINMIPLIADALQVKITAALIIELRQRMPQIEADVLAALTE